MAGEVAGVAGMTPEQWVSQLMSDSSLCFDCCYSSRITGDVLMVL